MCARLNMSSQRKRGHRNPLLTYQAIFISFPNCSAAQHSMSFIIQSKKHKVMINNYQHWKKGGTLNIENMTKYMRCQNKTNGYTEKWSHAQYINKFRPAHIQPLMFHFYDGSRDATAEAVDWTGSVFFRIPPWNKTLPWQAGVTHFRFVESLRPGLSHVYMYKHHKQIK